MQPCLSRTLSYICNFPVLSVAPEYQIYELNCYSLTSGKQLRVDIRCDAGTYVGAYVPDAWDLLVPTNLSYADFDTARKRLTGFSEVVKSFPAMSLNLPSDGGSVEPILISRVKRMLNVFLVQGAGLGELMFAACARKGMMEEKVLVTVTSDRWAQELQM